MEGRFGLWISILSRSARTYFQRELIPWRVGPGQQAYLLVLRPEEKVQQDELSVRLKIDKANVTRAVKSLVALGYMERERSDVDGRAWLVSLTREGIEARSAVEEISSRWLDMLKSAVSSKEWNETEKTLEKIAQAAIVGASSTGETYIHRSDNFDIQIPEERLCLR